MMKKLLHSFGVVLFLLVTGGNTFAQKDFDVYSPTTDPFEGLCYPIQTGKSVKVPITVLCNMTKIYQPYTVSINTDDLFNGYEGWFKIDNNSQTWMAENLRVTRYQNGDPIPNVKGDTDIWLWGKQTEGAYCTYKNTSDPDSIATFGFLYNGFAVTDSRGLAPEGWHVPTDAEWLTLIAYVDGGDNVTNEHAISNTAGGRLREAGTLHWGRANRGDNSSGFTALPGGSQSGFFFDIGYCGSFWTASKSTSLTQYFWNMTPDFLSIGRAQAPFAVGMSVRCIKDN